VPAIRPAHAELVSQTAGTDGPWPLTARAIGDRRDGLVSVGGVALGQVAAEYGTPAYVLDEADVRQRCRDYRAALGDGEVAYAAQAFCCRFMVHCACEEGLSLAVRSAGEIGVAASVGFPAERLIVHGNAMTPADMRAALDARAGRIVIDSLGEIPRLAAQVPPRQRVLLRVIPALGASPHPVLSPGIGEGGVPLADGTAAEAVRRIIATVVGRHGEAGDILARDVPLAGDVHPGDLLVAGGTGAYHHAMASSYNMVGRPPVIAVRDGRARVLVRRETDADLRRRDVGL